MWKVFEQNNFDLIRVELYTAELLEDIFMCMNKEKLRENYLVECAKNYQEAVVEWAFGHSAETRLPKMCFT